MTIDPHASAGQEQFLDVIDRDEAERRFHAALDLSPLATVNVPLRDALGHVLAADILAPIDVPGFDRSNVDGFAVRATDTFGATDERPAKLALNTEELAPGIAPEGSLSDGSATTIATGGVIPRGADAVVMVEYTDVVFGQVVVRRPVTPGANVTFAGTDIGRGETILRQGEELTSHETGVLAALGLAQVPVVRRPRVAIVSTGNELVEPGEPLWLGAVYDSNATILADAVRELGGEPVPLGIVPDDAAALKRRLHTALQYDVVLLSGGTSKGAGDLSYRVVAELGAPGIVAHGVALKPGKPLCLAVIGKKPVVILPGFPTSAIFTFHEFVAPVILRLAGRQPQPAARVRARLPMRINSKRGRTEYVLVGLIAQDEHALHDVADQVDLVAYPMGKGSGSVTSFCRADGFLTIPRQREYLEAGEVVDVRLLGRGLHPADLVVIGSHCVGLDFLLSRLHQQGLHTKMLAVGSTGGLAAAQRSECDLAGIHLLDPKTQTYNQPFVGDDLRLIAGYGRLQGIVFRQSDHRFTPALADAQGVRSNRLRPVLADQACVMVNRNRGSGTRVLIDGLLEELRPPGHATEAKSHNAVAAAVAQARADWGVCIETVARQAGLGFLPLQDERFDFVVPKSRWDRTAVRAFRLLLDDPRSRQQLRDMGFRP